MTENKKENLNNRMIKFLFEGAPVRGACVQMAEEWQEMIKFHHYPENVAALLGQFTAGALLLSSTIKFEGSLILQVKGSGPIAFIYAEVRNPMSVRAMAEIREGAEIKPEMDLQELINKDGKGLCALILDPKDRRPGVQPYQGMVSLESNSVAENLENYMATDDFQKSRAGGLDISAVVLRLSVQNQKLRLIRKVGQNVFARPLWSGRCSRTALSWSRPLPASARRITASPWARKSAWARSGTASGSSSASCSRRP